MGVWAPGGLSELLPCHGQLRAAHLNSVLLSEVLRAIFFLFVCFLSQGFPVGVLFFNFDSFDFFGAPSVSGLSFF